MALNFAVSGASLPFQVYGGLTVDSSGTYLDIVADGVKPYYWVLTSNGLYQVRLKIAHFPACFHFPCSNLCLSYLQVTVSPNLVSTHVNTPLTSSGSVSGMLSRMPSSNYLFVCSSSGIEIIDVTASTLNPISIWTPPADVQVSSCSVRPRKSSFSFFPQFAQFIPPLPSTDTICLNNCRVQSLEFCGW